MGQRALDETEGHREDRGRQRGQNAIEGAGGHRASAGIKVLREGRVALDGV
jgi:hypothetical protein